MKKFIKYSLIFLLAGCSSAKITTVWKSPAFTDTGKINKILVLSIINQKDRSLQEMMENKVVSNLMQLGYSAFSSLEAYGPKIFEGLSEKQALEKIRNSGADAVITIVLLNKHREKRFVEPRTQPAGGFWNYYDFRYNKVFEPGYYVTDTKYFWETNLYYTDSQQLLYSAQTRSFEYETKQAMSNDYASLIVADMLKRKVIRSGVTEREEE